MIKDKMPAVMYNPFSWFYSLLPSKKKPSMYPRNDNLLLNDIIIEIC